MIDQLQKLAKAAPEICEKSGDYFNIDDYTFSFSRTNIDNGWPLSCLYRPDTDTHIVGIDPNNDAVEADTEAAALLAALIAAVGGER